MTDRYLYQFQYILVGDKGVGKSSLLESFANNKFQENVQSTVGIDFHTKTATIDSHNFKLQLWDTAGQERFRAVVRPYFRNAVGAILVFDINNESTFTILTELITEVKDNSKPGLPYFILVGNKSDFNDGDRQVLESQAQEFASLHQMEYIETSAKLGRNIDQVFRQLTRKIYSAIQDGSIVIDNQWRGVKIGNELNSLTKQNKISSVDFINSNKSNSKGCC